MKNWFKVILRDARLHKVPTLFIRFEDLVAKPKPELENIMRFLLEIESLEGTNAARRI
jgi:hypothetical protein